VFDQVVTEPGERLRCREPVGQSAGGESVRRSVFYQQTRTRRGVMNSGRAKVSDVESGELLGPRVSATSLWGRRPRSGRVAVARR